MYIQLPIILMLTSTVRTSAFKMEVMQDYCTNALQFVSHNVSVKQLRVAMSMPCTKTADGRLYNAHF